MYGSLVRSGGIVAFHDIVTYNQETECEVARFWEEIKPKYRHQEIIEDQRRGTSPVAVTGATMDTAGLGVLFMP